MRIAIRFQGPSGPVVFECARRDYPASFELPGIIRKHARRLGVAPAGALHPVLFLNREVHRPEDLLAVDPDQARVVCAKLGEARSPQPAEGDALLGVPKVAS